MLSTHRWDAGKGPPIKGPVREKGSSPLLTLALALRACPIPCVSLPCNRSNEFSTLCLRLFICPRRYSETFEKLPFSRDAASGFKF